jgi:phosphate transport system protein
MDKYRIFDIELEKLTQRVRKMSHLVEEQLINSILALNNSDLDLASQVIENDNKIDNLDIKIDILCQKIFALQQPVATDLRYIIASLKINNDLERIGDHAVNIARKVENLSDYTEFINELSINKLSNELVLLFKDVNVLIKTHNLVLTSDILQNANKIKEDCQKISEKIIDEMMHKNEVILIATNIMIIVNLIDRVAAYSTNIAESMIFAVEGKIVKHQNKEE